MRKVNLLDCTFRDGGYYNNWSFEKKLIKDYLKLISKTNIEFVEIGFFTIKKNNNLGLTANINKKFFRNDEFSVLDSVIIPILLRLEHHQIKLPNNKASKPLFDYIERMQDLPSVKESFTSLEIELL